MLKAGFFWLVTAIIFANVQVFAAGIEKDIAGASDPADFARIQGATIIGYAHSDYDIGRFYNGNKARNQRYTEAEGKRTRIAYLVPKDVSTLQVLRSYQKAFDNLGKVQEIYLCRPPTRCLLGPVRDDQIDIHTVPGHLRSVYYSRNNQKSIYWYGTITTDKSKYHVSVFTGIQNDGEPNLKRFHGRPFVWLHLVELSDFKPTLEFVSAEVMTQELNQNGRVALYGIQFEFDSASLTAESEPELKEIAKTLQMNASMKLFVVGHTDNVGDYNYNRKLSEKRAQSVKTALVQQHGIDPGRLASVGVGPVAPVATNASEEGKALNRRVELVIR